MGDLWIKSESDLEKAVFNTYYEPHDLSDSELSVNSNRSNISSCNDDSRQESLGNERYSPKIKCFAKPLYPEKIRWFYKENKVWVPFCGYDSLRLETKHRELITHITLSKESKTEKIVVRGDLYEVDVLNRIGFPIYWNVVDDEEESFEIIRGTWFREASWQPLDSEVIADKLDKEHLRLYGCRSSNETFDGFAQQLSQKLHLNIKSLVIDEHHIDWYDQENIFIYQDSASHFIRHRLGLTKVGSKLNRGYKHDAKIEDKLPDITHLVFVIHGIGQKLKGGDICYQVARIRSVCQKVTTKCFPMLEQANQRVEFLPVEWRKSLVLDGNTVDSITLNRNKSLRNALNSTALDILYYSSPIYRPEMIGSLRSELNRLYSMFCARSPYFEDKGGKVSILAHSLGVVLTYDILTNWSPAKIYEYLETLDKKNQDKAQQENRTKLYSELNKAKERVHKLELKVLTKVEQEYNINGQLGFRKANFPSNFIKGNLWKVLPKLENLFCVGSPLSVFLALRGLKPQNYTTMEHILSENLCRRFFNIFHPSDPVVYRIEPLINQMYASIEPVRIYRLDHPNKVPYDSADFNQTPDMQTPVRSDKEASERSLYEDFLSRSSVYQVDRNTQSNYSFTGKIMKFIYKFKNGATDTRANSVMSQVASDQRLSMLDEEAEYNTSNSKKRKKWKIKSKHKSKETYDSKNNGKHFYQSHSSLSKCASFKRSKRPSWMEIAPTGQRHSLCHFSEIDLEEKMRHFLNSSNSIINDGRRKKSQLEESSDEETLRSEKSGSILSVKKEQENDSNIVAIDSTDSFAPSLKFRIDYKLPESRYENSYISVLTSHTSYWSSPELCMFMLTQIFGHLGKIGNPI